MAIASKIKEHDKLFRGCYLMMRSACPRVLIITQAKVYRLPPNFFRSVKLPIFDRIRTPGTRNPVSRWLLIFSFKCLCRYMIPEPTFRISRSYFAY